MESSLGLNTGQTDWIAIFKGAYDYVHKKGVYSEENFKVSKNKKDGSLSFDIEILTRLDNGEFLKHNIVYRVTKDYVPTTVVIDKYIGKEHVQERYTNIPNDTNLIYEFKSDQGLNKHYISVPPRFQVSTFATSTTFLFLASKKFDSTGRNFYNILVADNIWDFEAPPTMKYIMLERTSTTPVEYQIRDKLIKGTQYKVFSGHEGQNTSAGKKQEIPVEAIISKHFTIPYVISSKDEVRIQIRFLQEIEQNTIDD